MSARENARRALLSLAQAEIRTRDGAVAADLRQLRAVAIERLKASGVGTTLHHDIIQQGIIAPRDLIELAMRCAVVKTCGCGAEISGWEWIRLPVVGIQRFDDGGEDLELRNCGVCSSTLAIELPSRAA